MKALINKNAGLVFLVVITLLQVSCKKEAALPNILLILADDVGREVLGCYGGTSYQTPEIDALAEKGMLLDHVYAAPICHPSRVTLMTGQYPVSLGDPVWGSFPGHAEKMSFAWELKKAGYVTAVAGKWQLCTLKDEPDHPHRLGFDEYCLFGWHEGPRYYQPLIWQNGKIREDVKEKYGPDVYSDFLIDFMQRNRHHPFLAYYPMALIHDVSNDLEIPPAFGPLGRYDNVKEMVVEMDRRVGKMIQAVTDMGLEQNTLIIFLTDNGTNHNSIVNYENGEFIKEKVYSEYQGRQIPGGKKYFNDFGVRVPGIVVWPGKIEGGTVSEELIDFSDIHPTLFDLLGLPKPEYDINGVSFAGLITGEEYTPREWVYSQKQGMEGYMIRTFDWKLMWDGRLYDMRSDTFEENPILPGQDTPESGLARNDLDSILKKLWNKH